MTQKIYFNQSCKYPFDLDKVLYAAQDFRWCKWDDDWHSGVLNGNLIHIRQVDDVLEYKSNSDSDLDEMLRSYFRLDDPIDDIYDELGSRDDRVRELVNDYPWLRVLRQPDPWECMVAYMCAARTRITTTRKRVEAIAELGQPLELDGDVRQTFPAPEVVIEAGVEQLRDMKLGFKRVPRDIISVAERVHSHDLDLTELACQSYAEARLQLMNCNGILDKTADCIALFALGKMQAFPVDGNVSDAVVEIYFPWLKKFTTESLTIWAQERFGPYAGYANQYLFFKELQGDMPIEDIRCTRSYASLP